MNETVFNKTISLFTFRFTVTEGMIIKGLVIISGIILAGVLIGLGLSGMNLAAILVGAPAESSAPHTPGIIALEGGIVAITLLFGGFFIAGIAALIARKQGKSMPRS